MLRALFARYELTRTLKHFRRAAALDGSDYADVQDETLIFGIGFLIIKMHAENVEPVHLRATFVDKVGKAADRLLMQALDAQLEITTCLQKR